MSAELEMILKAKDEASGVFDKIKSGLGDIAKTAAGFAIGGALTKLPDFLTSAAQAAADDEASTLKVKKAIENSGASWDDYSGHLDDVIKAGQKKGETDDQVRDSISLLVAQTGDAGEAFKRFGLAEDLARGSGLDLETSSKLLGKATDENVNVLKKMGVSLKDGATEADLFGAVQAKFGGQADTFAKSTAGSFAQAKIRMTELKETIGYAVLPVMTALGDLAVNTVIPILEKGADVVLPAVGKAFDAVGGAVSKIKSGFMDFFNDPAVALNEGTPLSRAGARLAQTWTTQVKPALDEAITFIKKKLDELGVWVQQTYQDFQKYYDSDLGPALDKIKGRIDEVLTYVKEHWDTFKTIIMGPVKEARDQLKIEIDAILGILRIIIDLINGDWAKAWSDLKDTVGKIMADVKQLITDKLAEWRALGTVLLDIGEWFGKQLIAGLEKLPGLLYDAGVAAGHKLEDGIKDGIKSIPGMLLDAVNPFHGSSGPGIIERARDNNQGLTITPAAPSGDMWENLIPHYASGTDYVPTTGLAVVHQGEQIIPAGQSGGVHVHFHGPVYGMADFERSVADAVRSEGMRGGFRGLQLGAA